MTTENFHVDSQPMLFLQNSEVSGKQDTPVCQTGVSCFVCKVCIGRSEPDHPVCQTGDFGFLREINGSISNTRTGSDDWRTTIIAYLSDPGQKVDRKVRHITFKYNLLNDEDLYRWIAEDVLLKCLGTKQAKIAMGKVHEGVCGTHQSASKMKWLLRRAGFYWPNMIADCHRYYKRCEECQRFGNIQKVPAAMMHPIINLGLFEDGF